MVENADSDGVVVLVKRGQLLWREIEVGVLGHLQKKQRGLEWS